MIYPRGQHLLVIRHFPRRDSYLLTRLRVLYNTKPTPIPAYPGTMAVVVTLVTEVIEVLCVWDGRVASIMARAWSRVTDWRD